MPAGIEPNSHVESAEPDYLVRSVLRAATLLRLIREAEQPATLVWLSKQSGIAKPTVFRLVRTLIEADLIESDPREAAFRLGPLCVMLGQTYLEQVDILREARPILTALRDETSETVHLGILDSEQRILYLEKLEGTHAIGVMKSRVGLTGPAHCTGIGKMLLASNHLMPQPETLYRFTEATFADPHSLAEELTLTRERGYALDLEEHEAGVYCVAVPVYDSYGQPIAALSITGPGDRMPRERLEHELLHAALNAAQNISARLGWVHRATRTWRLAPPSAEEAIPCSPRLAPRAPAHSASGELEI